MIVQRIKDRTRGGQGAKTPAGNASKLKPLSPGYIKQRERDKKLSSETSPATSNLTRYGDMLDSLTFMLNQGRLFVTVQGADNVKKAIYTSEDRPWVNLTRADLTAIQTLVRKLLNVEIDKTF